LLLVTVSVASSAATAIGANAIVTLQVVPDFASTAVFTPEQLSAVTVNKSGADPDSVSDNPSNLPVVLLSVPARQSLRQLSCQP
jgi:hypothetical protein